MAFPRNTEMPNLFVIGAAKCGTTSLHHYLDLHPEISMSLEKEPNYFSPPGAASLDQRIGDREVYLGLFRAGTRFRGESSTAYARFPLVGGVPDLIGSATDDPKFIYLVRDPVDRVESEIGELLSTRLGEMKDLPADTSPNDLLGDLRDPANRFLCSSFYMTQIRQYLEHFPRESILVVDSDDLRSRRRQTVARIFGFIGVDEEFWDERMEVERYRTSEKRRRSELYVRLSRVPLLKAAIDRLPVRVKRDVVRLARSSLSRSWETPKLDDALRRQLQDLFRPGVAELREFTGQDFPGWSI